MSNTQAQGQINKAKQLLVELEAFDAAQATKLRTEMNARWVEHTATFEYVSSMISNLIDLVKQLRAANRNVNDVEVPEGYYAARNVDGDWAFYRVTEKGRVYVFRSDDTRPLPFVTGRTVKAKIVEMGLEASAEAFGKESGFCRECGRRLTDEVSLAIGIGPVCRDKVAG